MRRIVKHTLTVVTFVVGALCFAMFMITVKPDPLSAVPQPGKLAHCKMAASREPVCSSEPESRER